MRDYKHSCLMSHAATLTLGSGLNGWQTIPGEVWRPAYRKMLRGAAAIE